MEVRGRHYRSIWRDAADGSVRIIDQTKLPFEFEIRRLPDVEAAAEAIRVMRVRGAPLIGATAAHGVALALERDARDAALQAACVLLTATRPTAVNLRWAVERMRAVVAATPIADRVERARAEAQAICDEDARHCEAIGDAGFGLLESLSQTKRGEPLEILTHCNAGWLATVDWGTALAPIYKAHRAGLPIHVWVDETRPRNQGASLTAFELREQAIPHTVIVDNAGGHLMQKGRVDAVLVGSDRTTASGDVCNKIGTYLKSLAAYANDVPFYVALPFSTIDWEIHDGLAEIPIEERDGDEVRQMVGVDGNGNVERFSVLDQASPVANPAFDVTPSRYVTQLITEHGCCGASREELAALRASSGIDGPDQTP